MEDSSHATIERLLVDSELTPAAHLTCVGAPRQEIDAVARRYWAAGVRHLVALRGDPTEGEAGYRPHPDGYAFAADLVAGLKRVADFEISVACYPEVHPEAASPIGPAPITATFSPGRMSTRSTAFMPTPRGSARAAI